VATRIIRSAFDEYRLGAQIGQGGTGFVVSAATSNGSTVAIKYLNLERGKRSARLRFNNEIRFSQRVEHPNLIKVLDFGLLEQREQSAPFYVMPLYALTLRKVMEKGIAATQVLGLFSKMLQGIEAAHLSQVWHRDMKPENVLLSSDQSQLVIADFGIAHFSELEHYDAIKTHSQERLANFRYCAPEQAHPGQRCDQTADIYALGLILNEMFTGQVPRGTGYKLIGSASPEFGYLDALVERMIRQEPKDRIQSIDAIKREISALANIDIARQRVEAASRSVVPASEPDDPLIKSPIAVQSFDWKNDSLIVSLSGPVSNDWKSIFRSNRVPINMNSQPGAAKWSGYAAFSVYADESHAKTVLSQYKAHIESVNAQYVEHVRNQNSARLEQERRDRKNAAIAESKRLKVLESLRGV
jgi:serine/threonine protein kinase